VNVADILASPHNIEYGCKQAWIYVLANDGINSAYVALNYDQLERSICVILHASSTIMAMVETFISRDLTLATLEWAGNGIVQNESFKTANSSSRFCGLHFRKSIADALYAAAASQQTASINNTESLFFIRCEYLIGYL